MMCDPLMDLIQQINNKSIRDFTITILNAMDASFYKMPASITGKYHPEECCKEGGLIRHIQRACYFGQIFIKSCKWDADDLRGDIILASLLLHDIGKKEKYQNGWEYPLHPVIGMQFAERFKNLIDIKHWNIIASCILQHMGPWSPNKTKKPLNKYNMFELFVYQADYLASNKTLEIKL